MTAENRMTKGYVGISLGLLRRLTGYEMLTMKDMAAKMNSKGESLLRYYEPDHERLSASIRWLTDCVMIVLSTALSAWWHPRPGRKPYEQSKKSTS